jgi:hypothetical protein
MATNILFADLIANEAAALLYEKSNLIQLVSRNWSDMVAQKGESVSVISANAATVEDGDATFDPDAAAPTNVVVVLDTWKRTIPIKLGDKIDSLSSVDLTQIYAEPIAEALLGTVEGAIMTTAMTLTANVGETAPATFAPLTSDLKQAFDEAFIPDTGRYVVLGPTAENAFHQVFGLYNNSGSTGETQQLTGVMANKLGMSYFGSTRVPEEASGVAFHKSAIALVSRPLKVPANAQPGTVVVANYKGLGLRVRSWYSHEDVCTYLSADVLFGTKKMNERGFTIGVEPEGP